MDLEFLQGLITKNETKIVLLVMDGLGGLPREAGGKTELESAYTPHLDTLAEKSALGLSIPVLPGLTVESGPGHMGLFGYDPLEYRIGRGVLEAVGVGMELQPSDVAVRGNYCTLDENGLVKDRRAGRIADEISHPLSALLTIRIEDVDILVKTVRQHRLAILLRGPGLSADVNDTDPLKDGLAPLELKARTPGAEKTARILNQFLEHAKQVMQAYEPKSPANMLLLRGFDNYPEIPNFSKVFGIKAAAIAVYPTYRGIASLVGMHALSMEGGTNEDEFSTLEKAWNDFDFFYLHVKETDLAGEDGDFDRKVKIIEGVDQLLPRLTDLKPDVLIVTGDHSTPAVLKGHSWHPVPTLIYGKYVRPDGIAEFGECACSRGSLGIFPAMNIMPISLANAKRINKWGG